MSVRIRQAQDLLGMPVYSIAEGKHLGDIRTLLVDRQERAVGAVGVGGAVGRLQTVPFHQLRTIGVDIVLVENEAVLGAEPAPGDATSLDTGLGGRPVLDQAGKHVGEVVGFTVDLDTGRIVRYQVRPEAGFLAHLADVLGGRAMEIPDTSVDALGADALIIREDALAALHSPTT